MYTVKSTVISVHLHYFSADLIVLWRRIPIHCGYKCYKQGVNHQTMATHRSYISTKRIAFLPTETEVYKCSLNLSERKHAPSGERYSKSNLEDLPCKKVSLSRKNACLLSFWSGGFTPLLSSPPGLVWEGRGETGQRSPPLPQTRNCPRRTMGASIEVPHGRKTLSTWDMQSPPGAKRNGATCSSYPPQTDHWGWGRCGEQGRGDSCWINACTAPHPPEQVLVGEISQKFPLLERHTCWQPLFTNTKKPQEKKCLHFILCFALLQINYAYVI